ncbi:MAG: DUF4340 domain-containing protein [Thiogranum sp.]
MQKTIGILAVLLVAQVGLTIGMSFTEPDLTAVRPDTLLLEFGERTVDRLTIEGSDNQKLTLARQGEDWVLVEKGRFPADQTKVDRLLNQLRGLQRGLAVATTDGAKRRFSVSDEAFERRITLAQGDETLATLYLGTSPGMRRVHARTGDDDAVYTVKFGVHDTPVKPGDWEDKTVLQIPREEIETISLADLTLSRIPDKGSPVTPGEGDKQTPDQTSWSSDVLAEGESINQSNADALAEKLARLIIGTVIDPEADLDNGPEDPDLVIDLQRKDKQVIEYRLSKRDTENDYVLKSSSRPEYFRLPVYTGDALIKAASRQQLIIAATDAADEGEAQAVTFESLPADSSDKSALGIAIEEGEP